MRAWGQALPSGSAAYFDGNAVFQRLSDKVFRRQGRPATCWRLIPVSSHGVRKRHKSWLGVFWKLRQYSLQGWIAREPYSARITLHVPWSTSALSSPVVVRYLPSKPFPFHSPVVCERNAKPCVVKS